jgi:hypothetical protein
MRQFITPAIQTIVSSTEQMWLVQTQGTGDTTIPSNPNFDCGSLDCVFGKEDTGNLTLNWNDNAGADISGYVIVVNIEGTDHNLTDNTAGCDISESPAGTYTLQCAGFEISGSGCNCPMDMNVVSITDGSGNALAVETENCSFSPSDC